MVQDLEEVEKSSYNRSQTSKKKQTKKSKKKKKKRSGNNNEKSMLEYTYDYELGQIYADDVESEKRIKTKLIPEPESVVSSNQVLKTEETLEDPHKDIQEPLTYLQIAWKNM